MEGVGWVLGGLVRIVVWDECWGVDEDRGVDGVGWVLWGW